MIPIVPALALAAAPFGPLCRGAGLEAAVAHYADIARAMDPRRTAALYMADGVLVGPEGAPITGPVEIEAFLAGFGGYKLGEQKMTIEWIKPAAARGVFHTEGLYSQRGNDPKGAAFAVSGRFQADWRCTRAGWRVVRMHAGQ